MTITKESFICIDKHSELLKSRWYISHNPKMFPFFSNSTFNLVLKVPFDVDHIYTKIIKMSHFSEEILTTAVLKDIYHNHLFFPVIEASVFHYMITLIMFRNHSCHFKDDLYKLIKRWYSKHWCKISLQKWDRFLYIYVLMGSNVHNTYITLTFST